MNTLRIGRHREVPGRSYATPKEVWGFRLAPAQGKPEVIALAAVIENRGMLGLQGVMLRPRRCIRSASAWHVIFSQDHLGRFVHRAYVTVHMDAHRSIYLIKNRAVPTSLLPHSATAAVTAVRAERLARASIGRKQAAGLTTKSREEVWFPRRTRLHLAYKFRLHRRRPAGDWIVYVDALTGAVLWKYDNLAQADGRALVFDPNPVVALGDSRQLLADGKPVRRVPRDAYRPVRLRDVPALGLLNGPRVSTSPTRDRLKRRNRDFSCLSHEKGFEEVMTYFHLDEAVRYVQSLGYRGRRAIFAEPVHVDARASRDDNSWYSPSTRSLGFGTGDVDDAEDGETILHEFGHALQDAICPDFGQCDEAAAMGEGFGDYFAASFFARKKRSGAARALLPTVMSWDGILYPDPVDATRPPCVRRLDGRLTYESFDHSARGDEHDNGEIWSATLWDIWNALGRKLADRLIIESHFQLDGFTTFARGARAILDADRNLFQGSHLPALRRIFHWRGIGPID